MHFLSILHVGGERIDKAFKGEGEFVKITSLGKSNFALVNSAAPQGSISHKFRTDFATCAKNAWHEIDPQGVFIEAAQREGKKVSPVQKKFASPVLCRTWQKGHSRGK